MPKALWQWNRVGPADGVHRLNALEEDVLRSELARCCVDPRWVEGMTRIRPFKDEDEVYEASARQFELHPDVTCDQAAVRAALALLLDF
jgi:hypothetical protein